MNFRQTCASMWRGAIAAAPVRTWALIGSGPPLTLFAIWVTCIIAYGKWPAALAGKRLESITWIGLSCLFLVLVMQVSLAQVGVRAHGLGSGFDIGTEPEPDPPAPKGAAVTTTTTTTVPLAQGPASPPAPPSNGEPAQPSGEDQ